MALVPWSLLSVAIMSFSHQTREFRDVINNMNVKIFSLGNCITCLFTS